MSADPTFGSKFAGIQKRSETGLKPSETVGKQLCPLVLHLYGNLWTSQRGLKPSETVGKQLYPLILHLYGNLWTSQRGLKQA